MNLQSKLEPEIFEYIKEIASKIKNNRASVMVGAGFSRNAEQISQTDKQFLDWNSLGNVFFEKVNGHKPDGRNHYLNVLKLAEEVEAAYMNQNVKLINWTTQMFSRLSTTNRKLKGCIRMLQLRSTLLKSCCNC